MPVGSAVIFAPTYIGKTRRLGYTEQWNVSINQVPVALMGAGNAQTKRPFPQFGNVSIVTPMRGNSSYHGGNIKLEKRFSHGSNFVANYTRSKFIDYVPGSFDVGADSGGIQNYYDRKAERALFRQ